MNDKHKKILMFAVTVIFILSVFFSIKNTAKERNAVFTEYFDTVSEIKIIAKSDKPLSDCEKYMKKMNSELSADDENGLIYRFNNGETVEFSSDTEELITIAKDFSAENPDYFSVYLNPLIKAWDIKNNRKFIPDVEEKLSECANQNSLNLGGIAKGYVTEKLVEILKKDGVSSAMINLGGNAYAYGKKPTGENWRVGIQNPKDENGIIGIISAENLAVITSGDYQRYFELDGVRYHHILNPKTGYPANSGLHSVTVISDNPTVCDALSTAAFVAGLEKGTELLKKYDCMGIFITADTVYFSKELENIFKQTDFSYKYEFIY
ncbi:MAG: FAD:protein FMN transferase [Clostridia bacterium]|nr:FAD:protein FMN transferase [Clostridia bacterium]